MTDHVEASFYVQLEPETTPSGIPYRAHAVRMTKSKPRYPVGGTVMVKLTVRVPKAAFQPLHPEAIVVIPDYLTIPTPVEVQAEDPGEEV